MIAALLVTAAVVAPSAALAQVATPYQPPYGYTQSYGDSVDGALATWQSLRGNDAMPFGSYADFLLRHAGWPGEADMRKAAERNLRPDDGYPVRVIAFFTRYEPLTPAGWLRFAEALDGAGRRDEARVAARKAWTTGALSNDDAMRAMIRFAGAVTPADHDARMDQLLWAHSTNAAATQLSLTSPARRTLFDARLAMQTRSPDADYKAATTQAAGMSDAGWLIDRAAYLRGGGQEWAARALLAQTRRLNAPPADPGRWLDTLWGYAKGAGDAGQTQVAYDIARQLDDAYPPGTVIRDRPLSERDDYTNLTFLAGMSAFKRLGRPADAVIQFDRYAAAARTAQTQSKGLYWAGRAAEAAGRQADAQGYFRRAAAFFDQFYGQLATEHLGVPTAVPTVPSGRVMVSTTERSAWSARDVVRATELLGQRGDWANQSLFLRAIAATATSPGDYLFASELAQRIGRPDLGVMVGRNVPPDLRGDYVRTSFPVIAVPEDARPSWTMVHAISRQESQFDRKIVSRAGARGLMQLMPATASEIASKAGIYGGSLDDAGYNASLGAWYFGRLMDRYGGSYPLAVAAYNAGAGNVNKWLAANGDPRTGGIDMLDWIEAIPFKETRDYVQRVLENAVVYDQLNPQGRRMGLSTFLGRARRG